MTTTISVVGTIATDPKLISPGGGTQLCSFRLASDERRYDREQQSWVEGQTNWFGVVCFRALAPNAYASFRKGERVIVQGRLRTRNWSKDERHGTSIEIEAEAIGHDVRWGISRFDKRVAGSGGSNVSGAPNVSGASGASETAGSAAFEHAFEAGEPQPPFEPSERLPFEGEPEELGLPGAVRDEETADEVESDTPLAAAA